MRRRNNLSNPNIKQLSDNLFSKLNDFKTEDQILRQKEINRLKNSHNDSLSELLKKAQTIAERKRSISSKNKQNRRESENQSLFITGATTNQKQCDENAFELRMTSYTQPPMESQTDIIQSLIGDEQQPKDDLAQLRRMIEKTSQNLNAYKKKTHQTKNDILTYIEKMNYSKDFFQVNIIPSEKAKKKMSILL